ncbi:MAG: CDP-alcohol phosphatidyltransferase family protein [Candidatus Micrarchaeota archaeon]
MLSAIIPRHRYSGATSVIGKLVAKTGIDPNVITFLAVPLSILAAYSIAVRFYLGAFIFSALAMWMDALDGAVARAANRVTKFGNYFDAMVDKYVEMILYLGFCAIDPAQYGLFALIAAAGTMLISYAKPRVAIVIPTDNRDWPAIGERADRLAVLFLGLFACVIFGNITPLFNMNLLQLTLIIVASMTIAGSIERIRYAKGLINEFELKGNQAKKK